MISHVRKAFGARTLLGVASVVTLVGVIAAKPRARSVENGGNGEFLSGTYGGEILIIDEATFTVKRRAKVTRGVPGSLTLSPNKKHIYASQWNGNWVEVYDYETLKKLDEFSITSGADRVFLGGFQVDPSESYAIVSISRSRKGLDRYEFFPQRSVRYDLKTKAVTDTIKWPDGDGGMFGYMSIVFSPDGKYFYMYGQDEISIFDAKTFAQVDRWEYGRAMDDGLGRVPLAFGFGYGRDQTEQEFGVSTNLVTFTDPVQNRTMMALSRVNLNERTIDLIPIGPQTAVWFSLAPDKKRAYGIKNDQIGIYEFWTLDIEARKIIKSGRFNGRPRMGLAVSSNGKQLYIYGAGGTFDIYDAETYEHIRQVAMDGDMLGVQLLPPRRSGAGSGGN
jgi:DNA-binding beta-propeller fold protein YncE